MLLVIRSIIRYNADISNIYYNNKNKKQNKNKNKNKNMSKNKNKIKS